VSLSLSTGFSQGESGIFPGRVGDFPRADRGLLAGEFVDLDLDSWWEPVGFWTDGGGAVRIPGLNRALIPRCSTITSGSGRLDAAKHGGGFDGCGGGQRW
jgi:hypothetical protein